VVDVTGDNSCVTVVVRDNGVGISPEKRTSGLGLRGLEERARELSGTLTLDTGFGSGTTVRMWLPRPSIETGQ
jgi:two-component system sensor histidine kinase UhpB